MMTTDYVIFLKYFVGGLLELMSVLLYNFFFTLITIVGNYNIFLLALVLQREILEKY